MNSRVLGLLEVISNIQVCVQLLVASVGFKSLSPCGLLGDVILDNLVSRNVKHVVLDGQVSTGVVDTN